jgi:hypothetical protein
VHKDLLGACSSQNSVSSPQEATDLKYVAIALTIFTVFFIIFTLVMIKRIRIAIGVVQVRHMHTPSFTKILFRV